LHHAIELGVNFIDTARVYGDSERIVGAVVRAHPRDEIYVATKVPPKNQIWAPPSGIDPLDAFPGDHIRTSLKTSLLASGLDHIDVLQFHAWSDEWVRRGDWQDTIESLKAEGLIRAFGVSINEYQPGNALALIETGVVDSVQVIYNIFHQEPEERLLPACAEHGVGVIVRVALDEGGLTGRITSETTFPDGDFRNDYFGGNRRQQVQEHVEALVQELGIPRDDLPEIALRFALARPEVATVIPGMRSIRNVERNVAVSDGKRLDEPTLASLRRHRWERNFYLKP
jgi:aryl-alcohol dehydrogenase-like predicted oxidoreductase